MHWHLKGWCAGGRMKETLQSLGESLTGVTVRKLSSCVYLPSVFPPYTLALPACLMFSSLSWAAGYWLAEPLLLRQKEVEKWEYQDYIGGCSRMLQRDIPRTEIGLGFIRKTDKHLIWFFIWKCFPFNSSHCTLLHLFVHFYFYCKASHDKFTSVMIIAECCKD